MAYSDLLLLEENGEYWIAERFFSGEFKKYNNNFGFILDEDDPLNHVA